MAAVVAKLGEICERLRLLVRRQRLGMGQQRQGVGRAGMGDVRRPQVLDPERCEQVVPLPRVRARGVKHLDPSLQRARRARALERRQSLHRLAQRLRDRVKPIEEIERVIGVAAAGHAAHQRQCTRARANHGEVEHELWLLSWDERVVSVKLGGLGRAWRQ